MGGRVRAQLWAQAQTAFDAISFAFAAALRMTLLCAGLRLDVQVQRVATFVAIPDGNIHPTMIEIGTPVARLCGHESGSSPSQLFAVHAANHGACRVVVHVVGVDGSSALRARASDFVRGVRC